MAEYSFFFCFDDDSYCFVGDLYFLAGELSFGARRLYCCARNLSCCTCGASIFKSFCLASQEMRCVLLQITHYILEVIDRSLRDNDCLAKL